MHTKKKGPSRPPDKPKGPMQIVEGKAMIRDRLPLKSKKKK